MRNLTTNYRYYADLKTKYLSENENIFNHSAYNQKCLTLCCRDFPRSYFNSFFQKLVNDLTTENMKYIT